MLKVLIVDDEQFVRVSLRALYDWEANGFEIVGTADNGQEALEKMESLRPDILITDIVMPVMDGLQLLESIRERGYPVTTLVISNLSDMENVKSAFRLGAEDYYLKVNFEQTAFHEAMRKIKQAALHRRAQAETVPADSPRPRAKNAAELLAEGFADGFASPAHTSARHIFILRVKQYHSDRLNQFSLVHSLLCNMVQESLKEYSPVFLSSLPIPDALLVAVEESIPGRLIPSLLKKLDAQMRIYLQATADILHLSAPDGMPPFEKLAGLPTCFSGDGQPPVLWHDGEDLTPLNPVERVQRFIQQHIDQRPTLSEIAEHVGLNPSYLSRSFAQKTGMPLIQYINEQKMGKAALLLGSGKYKVKDVARLLGYDDPYYFTRLFNRAFQTSPTEYMLAQKKPSSGENV